MASARPVAVFAISSAWWQEVVLGVAPPDIDVRFLSDPKNPEQVRDLLPRADVLMTSQLPAEWVPLLGRCKLVQLAGVGHDKVDLQALADAGIPLASTPEGTIVGVAEHTILLILALSKQLVQVHESLRRGEYDGQRWRANSHFFHERTLGIVGLGRIGKRVAHLARGFEARLIYFDAFRPPHDVERELDVAFVPFDGLLAQADIVSVHAPLTAETRGLFGAEAFARMKPGALFVNTSRGGTYDMDALYESLRSGHLGGAGLDVFNPEPPPPDHPILRLPNVIATPHMATGTVEAHLQKAEAQFANFRRTLRGEAPHNPITVG